MTDGRILSNCIRCLICDEIIYSRHTHDFRWCSCGNCAVDGGPSYLRRVGENFEELSEIEQARQAGDGQAVTGVDAHDANERARLDFHKRFALTLTSDLIVETWGVLERGAAAGTATPGELLWLELLSQGMDQIIEAMTADTPEGRLLRSNSPFSIPHGTTDLEERRRAARRSGCERCVNQDENHEGLRRRRA